MPAVHQPGATNPGIVVSGGDVQRQPSQLGCGADEVAGTAQHRARQIRIEVRAGNPRPEGVAVPVQGRVDGCGAGADQVKIVGVTGLGVLVAQRQHGAAVEVEHQPADLVDGGHSQRGQPGGGAARFGAVLLQPDHLGAGEQRVADHREPVERQTAVEQVCLDPLRHQRRLADRHIAHQRRVGQRARNPGDGVGQLGVQRQAQPVAEDRLMGGRHPGCQCHRRRPVEDLTDHQIVEVGASRRAADVAVQSHSQ